MVECSKLMFAQHLRNATCSQLIHPWTKNCIDIKTIQNVIIGGYKFYGILYLMRFMIGRIKSKRKKISKLLLEYIYSGIFAAGIGFSLIELCCVFRKIFGKFNYYQVIFLPAFISGFVCIFLEPPYKRYQLNNLFVNFVFLYWIRTLEYKGYVKSTSFKEIALFMFGSSFLLYLMRQEIEKNKKMSFVWLLTPPKVNKEPVTGSGNFDSRRPSYCPHEGKCEKYVLNGTFQMFTIGSAMVILREIIPLLGSPINALKSITKNHFRLGLLFGGYIGIYRTVTCLLCRYYKKDCAEYALPAGFLAGLSLLFNRSLSISLASITSILQILVSRMYDRKLLPEKIPLPEILFAFCLAVMLHASTMHPEICPKHALKIKRVATNNLSKMVDEVFAKVPQIIN